MSRFLCSKQGLRSLVVVPLLKQINVGPDCSKRKVTALLKNVSLAAYQARSASLLFSWNFLHPIKIIINRPKGGTD